VSIIRQGSLFDLQDLYDLEPTHRYEAILSSVDVDSIVCQVSKKSWRGAPVELNYRAMIHSLIIRVFDRIPTIKDLIRRLNDDFIFKLNCGFLISDQTPSEAAYSRLISKLEASQVLEEINEKVVIQAYSEGFIMDEVVAIDATHFEARDQAPPKDVKAETTPEKKKRGRKSKLKENNG
jgi:transposase